MSMSSSASNTGITDYSTQGADLGNTLWILGGVAVLVALALILFTKK